MSYLGDFDPGQTIHKNFSTPDGLLEDGVVVIYKAGSATPITTGITLTSNFGGDPTLNHVEVDLSSNGVVYANENDFDIVLSAGTVVELSVAPRDLWSFSIGNRPRVMTLTPDERTAIAMALLDLTAAIDGETPRRVLAIIAATCAGLLSGARTGTEIFMGLDGSTTRAIIDADSLGNRTDAIYP